MNPRSTPGHLASLASPSTLSAGRLALERAAAQRMQRLLGSAATTVAARRLFRRQRRMRALVAGPGGSLGWRGVPAPPSPTGPAAVVRPIAVATCDMDRLIGQGRTPFPLPLQIGHECVAEVLAVGDDVAGTRVGDRVVVPFQINCGTCPPCRCGHTNNCESVPPLSMYGFGIVGGHWGGVVADEVHVPYADAMLVALPPGVEPTTAASVADTVCDGYRHVAPHLSGLRDQGRDPTVTILAGLGRTPLYSPSTPLYAGLVARALGAHTVHLVDSRAPIRNLAERLGLRAIAPRDLRGLPGAPLVVDITGSSRGLRAALGATAPDGICSSAGGLHTAARLPAGMMFARNQTLHLGRTHARGLMPDVLRLIADDELHPEHVITAHDTLDNAPAALDAHYRGDEVKTVLTL